MLDRGCEDGAKVALAVVMPVHNEEASIKRVVEEWWAEVECHTGSFRFLVLDDGSTDGTPGLLSRLRAELGEGFEFVSHERRGHGQTCLVGYQWAEDIGARHVLQIDSDGQCEPRYFGRFWALRDRRPLVYGKRIRRDDGLRRELASIVLRLVVRLVARTRCPDPNVPYRLMSMRVISPFVHRVPRGFDLANVALAVLLDRARIPAASVPIWFRCRYGGTPSVRLGAFVPKAFGLIRQLRSLV